MLVLARHIGQVIVIPALGVTIEITDIRGDKCKLGFTAPPEVTIHRREIWEGIQSGTIPPRTPPAEEAP